MRQVITIDELHAALKDQGVPREHVAFKCPHCGTVQNATDLIEAGAGSTFDEVEKYLGFSCVGRFVDGKGCDWTLGGLFQIHELEVLTPDGNKHPLFTLATPEEAKAHLQAQGVHA